MSYTSIEQLRSYLAPDLAALDRVTDQRLALDSTTPTRFWECAVDPSSLQIKSIRTNTPIRTTVLLTDSGVTLAGSPLVPGSVVVASDSSLGLVYVENTDFILNYETSSLKCLDHGAIEPNQQLTVWYLPFHLFIEGTDFTVDCERAEIKRLTGGNIAPGEILYLDFLPVFKAFDDAVLAHAANEANGLIEQEIDPDRQFGADPTLIAAATGRALEIVCRTAASRELSSGRGQHQVALAWIKLAEGYTERANQLLRNFHPPTDGPSAPVHI